MKESGSTSAALAKSDSMMIRFPSILYSSGALQASPTAQKKSVTGVRVVGLAGAAGDRSGGRAAWSKDLGACERRGDTAGDQHHGCNCAQDRERRLPAAERRIHLIRFHDVYLSASRSS